MYRNREISNMAKSGEELLSGCLKRIDEHNPSVKKYLIISLENETLLLEIENHEDNESRRIACVLMKELPVLTGEEKMWTALSLENSYEDIMESYDLVPGSKVILIVALIARLANLNPGIGKADIYNSKVEAVKYAKAMTI